MDSKILYDLLLEGNTNSLGRVLEVLEMVHQRQITPQDVYDLYRHENPIVSMRVSNLLKRLWREDPSWILSLVDVFINDAKNLKNPTFRWTIAQMVVELYSHLSTKQIDSMSEIVYENLTLNDDWIILTQSLKAIQQLMKKQISSNDKTIIVQLTKDSRKAVASQASKVLALYK